MSYHQQRFSEHWLWVDSGRSLIKIRKSTGPRTVPCGIPDFGVSGADVAPSKRTHCSLSTHLSALKMRKKLDEQEELIEPKTYLDLQVVSAHTRPITAISRSLRGLHYNISYSESMPCYRIHANGVESDCKNPQFDTCLETTV